MVEWYVVKGARCTCLTPTDQSFDSKDVPIIKITLFLVLQKLFYLLLFLTYHTVFIIPEELVETVDEMHESYYLLITHSDIS